MTLPRWFPREGRPLHVAVGLAFSLVMLVVALAGRQLGFVAITNFLGVLALALAHEQAPSGNGPQGDVSWSDFRRVNGGPWNGLWDVLSFLPAPTLWLGVWFLLR